MSLNGTLETFALPDVLALLAATKKTGELQVEGGRGNARLWLDKGEMVGADVPRATTFVDALFEMLRLTSGNFAFDNDAEPASPVAPMALEPLVQEAQSRLGEWKSIEAVVPSLACAVKLAAEVSGAHVSVTAEQWRTLVAVATNSDVEGVMTSLEQGEFESCRMLKDLVQMGLVAIADAAPAPAKALEPAAEKSPAAPAPPSAEKPAEAAPKAYPPPRLSGPPLTSGPPPLAAVAGGTESTEGGFEPEVPAVARTSQAAPAPVPVAPAKAATAPRPEPAPTKAVKNEADDESAQLVHQLAQLQGATPSPRPSPAPRHATAGSAAPAAPAAGPAAGPADDEAPLEDEAKGEEPLNRGLLLKFLNSVRS